MTNPLLAQWDTPFGLPPFDLIEDAHFEPALQSALKDARADIAAISENAETPTLGNTIHALELAGETLSKVVRVFFHQVGTQSNPEREALQKTFVQELTAYSAEITTNPAIFERLTALHETRDAYQGEDQRVIDLYYENFTRAGAALTGAEADRMTEIKQRLGLLGTNFTQNLMSDERDWHMELGEGDLEGLPDFLLAAAKSAAKDKGIDGHIITTSRSLIMPFLQFSPRRDLREKAQRAWAARGANGGETDNRDIAAEILTLREERAKLLGYNTFADYKLAPEMAGTPDRVRDLLMQVWEPAKAQADADAAILTEMMRADGINGDLMPWDWRYYSEKRRQAEHDLDEAELKPYLQLDRMIEAAFDCAGRLFGIKAERIDVTGPHPDARIWNITKDGRHMATFVGDYFARGGKRSGAWCGTLRDAHKLDGDVRPIVTNVCNFAKPPEGEPALLSYDDARTLFHEFGHALHHIMTDVRYPMISGTSVARDFVELPSQLYEHWLEVPEVLAEYATHSETGEPMPRDLLDRLLGAATYDMGFQTVEYVASALVDLAFHEGAAPADPMAKQAAVLADIGMPAAIEMRHATPHFAHVFAGDGYSSGYYSYMWSEVMDADAFDAFTEAGSAFDEATADKLVTHILAAGGSRKPEELYTAFRGRMPGVDALLKGRGLAA
ncbi:M3 family metallopeptidase [Shimia ponticola]|uniref:M3 family metallopeptidase n=1 Tax=Shimia ponticola TaxID=2582893 RepID=UPI0011BE2848|nr:M3 family metallopeptidase [Shimia ponticola]